MAPGDEEILPTLDEATRVTGGSATLSPWFRTAMGPFGGYLAAIALRAAAGATALDRPASFSCQFLDVGEPGEVELSVTSLKASTRAEALSVTMQQHGKPLLAASAWFVQARKGIDHGPSDVPSVPPPALVPGFAEVQRDYRGFAFLDARPIYSRALDRPGPEGSPPYHVSSVARLVGDGSGLAAWLRVQPVAIAGDPVVDAARVLLALDWLAPYLAALRHAESRVVLHSTLDVSVSFHDTDNPTEWLYCDVGTEVARHGVAHGSGRLWSEDGRLVASGRLQMIQRVRL